MSRSRRYAKRAVRRGCLGCLWLSLSLLALTVAAVIAVTS
jgi:hypothetical protein